MFFLPSQSATTLLLGGAEDANRDVSQARLEVSARLRRFLGTLAHRSAAAATGPIAIVEKFEFVPGFGDGLAERLGLEPDASEWTSARSALARELAEWVTRVTRYSDAWGDLTASPGGDVLLAADRARIADQQDAVRAVVTRSSLAAAEARGVSAVRAKFKELEEAVAAAIEAPQEVSLTRKDE